MKRVAKFQEGGTARSGISNEPVGAALRRLFRRSEPMQGPPAPSSSGQRPQEDRARMAAEAAAEFDREEAALAERVRQRRNRPSAITNQPVGERLFGRAATPAPAPAPAMPAPTADYEERMRRGSLPAGRSATPGPMGDYSERAAAGAAARPRPAQRQAPRPRYSEADIARIRSVMEGGDIQPEQPGFFERMGIRRTNETGMEPGTIEHRRNYLGSGAADTNVSYNKKGGLLKAKAPMKKGGKAMMYREGGKVRQGMQSPKAQEARAEMAEDVMKRSMPAEPKRRMRDMMSPEEGREYDAPLTPQERERMRASGFKKGGMIKPKAKTAMKKGGAVKAPAKKMAHGGKVHGPKKMMKGGMTSEPKKMMGGGRAMYAKGGMAKGCK